MLRAIIIDDEEKSRENLRILVQDFCPNVQVMQTAKSVAEAIEAIETYSPDLIFLDIQMQKETGFDLLKKIQKIDFEIIFTTAHAEYAIDAIKFAAIDYLLKPIDLQDLKMAIRRVEKKLRGSDFKDQLDVLMHNFRSDNVETLKLALPTSEGLNFVNIKEILYCEATGNYTKIFVRSGQHHLVSKTLKEYEKLLENYHFFRIHHAYMVNLKEIKKYIRGEGGYVIISNDTSLDVSKRKKEAFLKRIEITGML